MRLAPGSKSTLLWAGGLLILLVLLWPLTQGAELRTRASQRLLDQGWNPGIPGLAPLGPGL